MSKKKRKNTITLVSLLLALAALVAFYFWYFREKPSNEGNDKKTEQYTLATLDTSKLQTITLKNEHLDMTLVLEDETWKWQEDKERPINQSNVKKMISIFDEVTANQKLSGEKFELSEYGLDDPYVELQVTQTDGYVLQLKIGIATVDKSGYYALVNDDSSIYILDKKYGTSFQYTELEMTSVEDAPGIEATSIFHILVNQKDKESFELKYDVNNKVDKTQKGYYPWVILQPYEEGLSADGTKVSNILPYFADMNFIYCVDYVGEDRAFYGLENPSATVMVQYYVQYTEELEEVSVNPLTGEEVTEITHTEEKSFTLYVGKQNEEGNYYVGTDVSKRIYTMEAEKVNQMLQVDPFSCISSYVFLPHIDSVDRVVTVIDGKTYTMEIKRKTVKNDSGEDIIESTYYYNGEVVEEDVFKDVYQAIISVTYDSKVNDDLDKEDLTPYVTVTFYMSNGTTDTTSYIPYNNNFYLIQRDGKIRFFADMRRIDHLVKAVIEFVAIEDE